MPTSKPSLEDLRARLSAEEFHVCCERGTEAAFTGAYWATKTPGIYRCRCCDAALFQSGAKYDSGTGWPSFFDAVDAQAVATREDRTHGMRRVEILCAACGAHLGHVFPDGPAPTGLRYCTNSASLRMEAAST